MRLGATMVIGKPRLMHHSMPGEIRSFTLSMFWSVILSPGTTSARAPPARRAPPIASAAASPVLVLIVGPPAGSVARVHQRRDREPVARDAGLVALVVIPALLARKARARQRRLGCMLELHVHHHDRGREGQLVLVLDHTGAVEGLLPEAHVVDPDLPQLARALVDVAVRDAPGLLVDEEDALAVGVLRQLRDALECVDVPLLPHLVHGPVDLVVPLHWVVLRVNDAQDVALAQVLRFYPSDLARVAVVAVDVGVLAEERVRARRGGQATDPPERRQVEPRVVLLVRGDVAVPERAHALQVEGLEDRVETLLGPVAVRVRLLGLGIDVQPPC